MTAGAPPPPPTSPCPDHRTPACAECYYDEERRWIDPFAEPPSQAAVVAEDLRDLAEQVPFDQATRELLHEAADALARLAEVRAALDDRPTDTPGWAQTTLDRIAQAVLL